MLKLSAFVLLSFLSACGGPLKYSIASSPKAPGADAKLVANVMTEQGQTEIELTVEHLPPPDRVNAQAQAYVAWARKNSETAWARIGGLDYSADDRKGTLKGSVPNVAFDFEVSAEKEKAPASPSSDIVLSQRVEKQ